MNVRYYILSVALGVTGVMPAQQDSLRREVVVEKNFTPIVHDASKINVMPAVVAPNTAKQKISYSEWSVPVQIEPTFAPLSTYSFTPRRTYSKKRGYADLAIGNNLNIVAGAGYRILDNDADRLGIWYQHNSADTYLDYAESKNATGFKRTHYKLNDNRVNLDYAHTFKSLVLSAEAGYRYNAFDYYGWRRSTGEADPAAYPSNYLTQAVNQVNARVGISSSADRQDVWYSLSLGYDRIGNKYGFNDRTGSAENQIALDFKIAAPLNRRAVLSIDGALNTLIYEHVSGDLFPVEFKSKDYTMLTFNPHFDFQYRQVRAKIGLRFDLSFNEGTIARFAPDVRFDWEFYKGYFLFASLGGGKELNTWRSISDITRYYNPSRWLPGTYTPLDLQAGFSVNSLPGFALTLYGGYQTSKNILFRQVVADTGNDDPMLSRAYINWIGIDAYCGKLGVNASYRYGDQVEITADMAYRHWFDSQKDKAITYDRPRWEGKFRVNYDPIKPLSLYVNYYMALGRTYGDPSSLSRMGKLRDIHLLGLGASYRIKPFVSVFVQADNLLNRKYEIAYGMPGQGIYFLAGASFKF